MATKRTITPEHLAAMQAGKEKAKKHRERMVQISELDERLHEAARSKDVPVRLGNKKRRHKKRR